MLLENDVSHKALIALIAYLISIETNVGDNYVKNVSVFKIVYFQFLMLLCRVGLLYMAFVFKIVYFQFLMLLCRVGLLYMGFVYLISMETNVGDNYVKNVSAFNVIV